uniref:Putative secreted protein n=1 Tax=Amblyomma triste TaxID=251400 RepID=A0A023G410_AMBTT
MKITGFITVLFFATTDPIYAAANRPQPRTTVACVPPYLGKGYARAYSYKCKLATGTYPNNTPCLPVTHGGNNWTKPDSARRTSANPSPNLIPS